VSAPAAPRADASASLGFWLAIAGIALLPVTLAAIGASPQRARATVFLLGLVATAAVSICGGVLCRRALSAGTSHTMRAIAGGVVGLVVGATATMFAFWSLVGIVL
jgi:spore maturation protein SpmA